MRRISYGVGVEKGVPIHAPTIEKIETVQGVRSAARTLLPARPRGKSAKVKEPSESWILGCGRGNCPPQPSSKYFFCNTGLASLCRRV